MISVDTIYQRVLAIANKEQRGYITPQEFNLLANQAQGEIFEGYFYEIDRLRRLHGSQHKLSDKLEIINSKIKKFYKWNVPLAGTTLPAGVYRVESLYHNGNLCQRMDRNEVETARKTAILKPTPSRPIYHDWAGGSQVRAYNGGGVLNALLRVDYIRKPKGAKWAYVVTNEKALYNAGSSQNFELHQSEKQELVQRILELAGVTIAKVGLAEIADKQEKEMTQPEKQ